jgi:hypothetical protein
LPGVIQDLRRGGLPWYIDVSYLETLDNEAKRKHEHFLTLLGGLEKCCLFLTEKRRVGLVFGDIKKGDVVATIQGLKRQLILRPEGTCYKLVGNAFVGELAGGQDISGDEPDLIYFNIV